MPLLPDRETHEWIDLADALNTLEQSFPYTHVLAWLEANRNHRCPDFNDLSITHDNKFETAFLMGVSSGYARALKAIPELRAYCETQATRDRKKEKTNAARREVRDRRVRGEEYS